MKSLQETVSFDLIKQHLKTYIKSEVAKIRIDGLVPLTDPYFLARELEMLKEMMKINASYGLLPITNSVYIEKYLDYALKGGILSPQELVYVDNDIKNVDNVIDFIKKCEGEYPLIIDYIRDFASLKHLSKAINGVISPSLTIFDTASKELQAIRLKITRLESSIKSTLNSLQNRYRDFLGEGGVTLRNGHYVLPVLVSEKNKVPGIVHDVSTSGQTIFIEPSSLVELNNNILLLKTEEEEEIKRILLELTKMIISSSKELKNNNIMLGELDFIKSKAQYALDTNSYVSNIAKKPLIDLKGARHPHIDPKVVVANDFYLDQENSVLILSGPNAGGKTVAMKCVGLLCYMHQCGLAIPTKEEGNISMFDHFLCDIGDQQSLNDNLSTFSGHMESLKVILNTLTNKSLVLIDEIGTGTDPLEGEALAISLIKAIKNNGALTMISSHFNGVKEYAFNNNGILIGSMLFNEQLLLPTYKLKVGLPGRSYALEVARRHGLPTTILEEANSILENSKKDSINDRISYLETMILDYEKKLDQLKEKEAKIVKNEQEIAEFYQNMNKTKEEMLLALEEERQEKLALVEQEIAEILEKLKSDSLKYHEALEIKRKVDTLKEEVTDEDIDNYNDEIHINDYVLVVENNIQGRVTTVNKNQVTLVSSEGMSFRVKRNKVKRIKAPRSKPTTKKGDPYVLSSLSLEHNVIGMRVEEALESVAKYLDSARVRRLKTVRIIHGLGTGALKRAIHEYLEKQNFIESYRPGLGNEGGLGATVVTLK